MNSVDFSAYAIVDNTPSQRGPWCVVLLVDPLSPSHTELLKTNDQSLYAGMRNRIAVILKCPNERRASEITNQLASSQTRGTQSRAALMDLFAEFLHLTVYANFDIILRNTNAEEKIVRMMPPQ